MILWFCVNGEHAVSDQVGVKVIPYVLASGWTQ